MQNGELLKNFPQRAAPNSGRRALANLRIVAANGVRFTDLKDMTKDFFEFGLLVQYPGKIMDYGWDSDVVGRICEAAYDIEKGLTPTLLSETRAEDVLKEKILIPCKVQKFKFYVL
jgi:hypothetical protein